MKDDVSSFLHKKREHFQIKKYFDVCWSKGEKLQKILLKQFRSAEYQNSFPMRRMKKGILRGAHIGIQLNGVSQINMLIVQI